MITNHSRPAKISRNRHKRCSCNPADKATGLANHPSLLCAHGSSTRAQRDGKTMGKYLEKAFTCLLIRLMLITLTIRPIKISKNLRPAQAVQPPVAGRRIGNFSASKLGRVAVFIHECQNPGFFVPIPAFALFKRRVAAIPHPPGDAIQFCFRAWNLAVQMRQIILRPDFIWPILQQRTDNLFRCRTHAVTTEGTGGAFS